MTTGSSLLDLRRLKELMEYDPATGVWTRLVPAGNRTSGTIVGTLREDGYRKITIDGKHYLAHRLAYFYMTGEWPSGDIDHIRGKDAGDQWDNLRVATRKINAQNKRRGYGRTGHLGVAPNGSGFQARIKVDGKVKILGQFRNPKDAHAAYVAAKRIYHEGCTL